jgi:uncharacterized protein with FMN-binding domain
MKKYVLGIGIAIIFLAYSGILRHQHSESVVAPASLSDNSSDSTAKTSTSTSTSTSASSTTATATTTPEYKDGTYDGSVANAFYGNVQVSVTIVGGKITAVNFLEYPNDNPNSLYVNQAAMPYLKQEAIKSQSSNVSLITGATYTSQAFNQSLSNALNQAKQGL